MPRELVLADAAGVAGAEGEWVVASRPARELIGLRREHLATSREPVTVDAAAFEVVADGEVALVLSGPDGERTVWTGGRADGPALGAAQGDPRVRVLVDGSVLETFAGLPATLRAYPRPGETWLVRPAPGVVCDVWLLGAPG